MKITYTPNPLETIVELDETEIEMLRLKIKIEQYEERMFSAHWNLTRTPEYLAGLPRMKTVEEARAEALKDLDPSYWCDGEPTKLDARVDELLQHYLEELKGMHIGDCTCVPCSCSKCHAESVLGIDTLKPFPGKHELHHIQSVFSRWNPETKEHNKPEVSLDEALEKLRTYKPAGTWDGWEAHIDRWTQEAKRAYEYLLNYRNTHFAHN